MYIEIEIARLDYFRNKQDEIQAEAYQGIIDSIHVGETRGSKVGRRIIFIHRWTKGYAKEVHGCNGIGAVLWKTRYFSHYDMQPKLARN